MAKEKRFVIHWEYLSRVGKEYRTNSASYAVPYIDYENQHKLILKAIKTQNHDELSKLLREEYIYPEIIRTYARITHDTFSDMTLFYTVDIGGYTHMIKTPEISHPQRSTETYEVHVVAPFLEELLTNHLDEFQALYAAASDLCRQALMDFSGLELNKVDLSRLDLSYANLTGCDLRKNQHLTQEILDSALTYEHATLPRNFIPFWTSEKKNQVLERIKKLKNYGNNLQQESTDEEGKRKGELAVQLANELKKQINGTTKYNGKFQRQFYTTLHEHDEAFSHKRFGGLKTIIINISLCALGLGAGYLLAGGLHYAATGRFLFFDRTESEQLVASLDDLRPNI